MREFNYRALAEREWDTETLRYVASIHTEEAKGETMERFGRTALDSFVDIAIVQSTETSNEIEGIRTSDTRLRQLMAEKTTPRNRDEAEIVGYRDALRLIHESFDCIPISTNYILQLHKILFSYSEKDIGGRFKRAQNYIGSTDPEGHGHTFFTPLSPFETPLAMERICDEYNMAIGENAIDPLVMIPVFIHDFLCIHPFTDGNGRMSRLLTTLLLYRSGFSIGRYISLEAKISSSKEGYYEALRLSEKAWVEGKNDPAPFIKYMLGTILSAYRDLNDRMTLMTTKEPVIETVRKVIAGIAGRFTKRQVWELCPWISDSAVELALKQLVESGEIERIGKGKNTCYVRENG